MKKIKFAALLSCLLILVSLMTFLYADEISQTSVPVTGQISTAEGRVSMDFENAALKDVLKAFSRQTGISFIANEAIEDRKVTVLLNNVSIPDALSSILDANGLGYEKEESDVYLIKPTGKEAIKTITRVFRLNYLQVYKMAMTEGTATSTSGITIIGSPTIAAAGSTTAQSPASTAVAKPEAEPKNIIEIIKSFMSKNGKIVADRRNNSLIITDIPDVFPSVEETIKQLDVEPIQIMIEARIIETTTNALKRIGMEYGSETQTVKVTYTGSSSTTGGSANTTNPTFPIAFPLTENFIKDVYGTNLAASGLFKYGTLRVADMDIVLKLFAQDEDTKYLSRPKIMTINNEPAIIKISANTAIGTVSSSVTQTGEKISTAERAETGIVLKVTPQVNDKGDIFMYIEPSVSRAIASKFFPTTFVDPSYRAAASTVMIKDSETVVVGGLIQTDNFKTSRKVPILGDIPFLGEAFKSRYYKAEDTELIIFITPHIINRRDKADGEFVIPRADSEREYMLSETLDKYTREGKSRKQEEPKDKKRGSIIDKLLKRYSSSKGK